MKKNKVGQGIHYQISTGNNGRGRRAALAHGLRGKFHDGRKDATAVWPDPRKKVMVVQGEPACPHVNDQETHRTVGLAL